MDLIIELMTSTVEVFLYLLAVAIVLRLFLPVLGMEEGLLYGFAVAVSEPVVSPVRNLLSKNEFFSSSPMDMSYFVTVMAIMVFSLIIRFVNIL